MNVRRIAILAAIALLPFAAGAATFIIPAAGSGPGVGGSQWESEVVLHSSSANTIDVTLTFHDGTGAHDSTTVQVAPRSTMHIDDIVRTRFNRPAATGGIEITVPDRFASKIAISSRALNRSSAGLYGQDIPVLRPESAAGEGTGVIITGPSVATEGRLNFGVYNLTDSTIDWKVVRKDGSMAAFAIIGYAAGTHVQYNNGVLAQFNRAAEDDDVIVATIVKGSAFVYGSIINSATGDPTYVAGFPTRPDIQLHFNGVDADFNGTTEILDADHDGTLDAPVDLKASQVNVFRIVVDEPAVAFEQIPTDAPEVSISSDGVVTWNAGPLAGGSATLRIRLITRAGTDIITIPVRYR